MSEHTPVETAAATILKAAQHDPPFTLDDDREYRAAVYLAKVAPSLLAALRAVSQSMHEARQKRKPLQVSADDVAFVDAVLSQVQDADG